MAQHQVLQASDWDHSSVPMPVLIRIPTPIIATGSTSGVGTEWDLCRYQALTQISNSSANNPVNLPNIVKPVKPTPGKLSDLPLVTDEYVKGSQQHFSEYQKRMQRWAAHWDDDSC